MDRIDLEVLLREVARRAGMPQAPRQSVVRMLDATLAAIAGELPTMDRIALEQALPTEVAAALHDPRQHGTFFQRVAKNEHVIREVAVEHAESALRALGELLDPELVLRMKKHLPKEIAVHLEERPVAEPPPRSTRKSPQPVAQPSTLATGRPWSARPISEAAPDRAQSQSIAKTADPHGDTKLSSSRGMTQQRFHESMAEGAPPQPKRPVAG